MPRSQWKRDIYTHGGKLVIIAVFYALITRKLEVENSHMP